MEEQQADDGEQAGGGGGFNAANLQSYIAFGKRAIAKKWGRAVIALVVGLTLTVLTVIYAPRTYSCTTILMTMGSAVLDQRDGPAALAGAADLIVRHESLEQMIRDKHLLEKNEARRPPILRLKDRIVRKLAGPLPEKLQIASLVGTLETKITVTAEKSDLTIKVDWTDAQTAAELADAAAQSFLNSRRVDENGAFEDKMKILDGHAANLRAEIETLVKQIKTLRDKNVNEARALKKSETEALLKAAAKPQAVYHRALISPDEGLPELKQRLIDSRNKLAGIEADRERALRDQQAKLQELSTRYTSNHPEVVAAEGKIAALSQVPSDVALLRAEVKDLESELRSRQALGATGAGDVMGGAGVAALPKDADELSPEVMDLLSKDNLDPALTTQLSATVIKYGALKSDLLNTRVDLDTAQAAFNHRYQVIVPAEVPTKPTKPKPALLAVAGLFVSLLIALLLPILSELREGVIVERWQVEHLQLPVLAELRLPPYSPD